MPRKNIFNVPPALGDGLQTRLAATVKPLSQQKRVVSPQEWKFVQELCANDGAITLKEAAIRAGYSPTNASAISYRLTDPQRAPHVVAAIQEFRKELAERYGTNFERHMRDLQKIRDAAMDAGNFGAAVTAEYRRGQALGTIYIERKEIRVGLIDSMSKEDVMRRLNEIQQIYGGAPVEQIEQGSIIDMTPEEISVAKTPPLTIAQKMQFDERDRRVTVEEARRERKRQRARDLLTKIHGAKKAAILRPDLFTLGGLRDSDGEGDEDEDFGVDAGGGEFSSEDDDNSMSDLHFDPEPHSGDEG
jgi:phage terminase small subunit